MVAPERVAGRDLDESDRHPVRALDPHLDQSPGLGPRFLPHPDARGEEPPVLSVDVADLDHQRPPRGTVASPGDLQEPRAEEEDPPAPAAAAAQTRPRRTPPRPPPPPAPP